MQNFAIGVRNPVRRESWYLLSANRTCLTITRDMHTMSLRHHQLTDSCPLRGTGMETKFKGENERMKKPTNNIFINANNNGMYSLGRHSVPVIPGWMVFAFWGFHCSPGKINNQYDFQWKCSLVYGLLRSDQARIAGFFWTARFRRTAGRWRRWRRRGWR